MTSINDVMLEGIIVHKFVTPKIAILTINTGNATPEPNYPKVLFFGDFIKDIEINYEVKDHVKIIGNIQSSRYKPGIKNQNTISIFGEGIEHSKTTMKETFGVETSASYYKFKNEIKISGSLISIEKAYKNLVKLKVLTKKNDRISFVTLVHYTDDPDAILNQFAKDDDVCIIGCVQTTKKENNGETHYFENYVANVIAKAEE
jgi:hypothetical protein